MNRPSRKVCFIVIICAVILLVAAEIIKPSLFDDTFLNTSFLVTITRLIGSVVFIFLILYLGFDVLNVKSDISKDLIFIIPCLIVSVNNLPYISLVRGDAYVSGTAVQIIFFAVECICVASFEELAFRGVLFPVILKKRRSVKGVFFSVIVSSIIFGLTHIVNLFYGASIGSVVMQIGYSALVGCMCAFVLIKTHCIWICVLIHAVYNFCGQIVPRLGKGEMLNTLQIVITVIISVACAIYIISSLLKTENKYIDRIYIQ